MATHSRILAWEISWAEEPGGLQSVGSQRSQIRLSTAHSTLHRTVYKLVPKMLSQWFIEISCEDESQVRDGTLGTESVRSEGAHPGTAS